MSVGQNMKKVVGIVPTNPEQIEVMQLEGCNRPTCNKLGLSASIRSVVYIELRLMTDGLRRTQGHNIHRASVAWRGKSPCVRSVNFNKFLCECCHMAVAQSFYDSRIRFVGYFRFCGCRHGMVVISLN